MPSRSRNKKKTTWDSSELEDFYRCNKCSYKARPVDCERARQDDGFDVHLVDIGCGRSPKEEEYAE